MFSVDVGHSMVGIFVEKLIHATESCCIHVFTMEGFNAYKVAMDGLCVVFMMGNIGCLLYVPLNALDTLITALCPAE
jgi:hypothetical protein